ncbi:hypothetical protein B9G55_17555 [Saccharibacillus sp. O16]|nr:hypothetical protein B9G55_17555 [Saccharibacillus sp. O16]
MKTSAGPRGLANLERFDLLPQLRAGVRVLYEGSIDKRGFNADWDWWLYKEGKEWVIFDAEGPGCLYNFVQHRYPDSEEPTFRFYFDGEETPRFEIRHSEFGHKAPFLSPLADAYLGPEDGGRGPIRVVRSFVPMAFERSCRITSDIRLKGAAKGDGGWGHVVYHAYTEAASNLAAEERLQTFTGSENYERILDMWRHVGRDPKPASEKEQTRSHHDLRLAPGESILVFEAQGAGSISAIEMKPVDSTLQPGESGSWRSDLWIRAVWDDHEQPDVYSPLGVFFANELGENPVGVLSHGLRQDGSGYCYFPMPYWTGASVELVNRGDSTLTLAQWETSFLAGEDSRYLPGESGYFRTSAYYEPKASPGADSVIGRIEGRGHLVAGHVTAHARRTGVISCEGDVRVHIDGNVTPQVESDGSESWVCYGWGFPTPPESNPSSAYDGLPDNPWSMVRLCAGDWYPFQRELVFGIESGEFNNQYLRHSGILFYYGLDEVGMTLTDELNIGDPASEGIHEYRVHGDLGLYTLDSTYEDGSNHKLEDTGRELEGASEFSVSVQADNRGVRLRRRSDQVTGRQRANVYVDGQLVEERSWYFADRNPYRRWLEDEFEIPEKYTAGKSDLRIKLEYVQDGETRGWNEFYYWVYSIR